MILHYRQVFLYIMRHLRELSLSFTKLKFKFNEKKIRTTKNFNKFVLYELINLTKRLKFKSKKINDLKTKNFNHVNERSSFEQSKFAYVVDEFKKCQKKKCACFFDMTFKQSKNFFFLDNMYNIDKS